MDKFEEFIVKHKAEIQNDLPNQGHFERFELKLRKPKPKKIQLWHKASVGIAAAILLGFVVFQSKTNSQQTITASQLSDEYANLEYFYTNSINTNYSKLESIAKTDNKIMLAELNEELKEYDKVYNNICKELNAVPNDERVINALISFYQTKLSIIEKILSEIEKQQKVKYDETTKGETFI